MRSITLDSLTMWGSLCGIVPYSTLTMLELASHSNTYNNTNKRLKQAHSVLFYEIKYKNMITTITEYDFMDAFKRSDTYKDNFSYTGLKALFAYLEEYEESTGEQVEFDMIALCCDYTEYASAWEAMEQYQPEDMPTVEDTGVDENGHGMDLVELSDAQEALALEWLSDHTEVIPFSDDNAYDADLNKFVHKSGVIIANF